MLIVPLVVEEDRRQLYDALSDKTEANCIDLQAFYNDPSYFHKSEHGQSQALSGCHSTLIHWPLCDYQGGSALQSQLVDRTTKIASLVGRDCIQWVRSEYWHSTIFSPVHSSNPAVISRHTVNVAPVLHTEVPKTLPYILSFTRIVITADGTLLAVAYAHNEQLNSLRERLLRLVPGSSAPPIVHITLGHLVTQPTRETEARLNRLARSFRDDRMILGQIAVDFLMYGIYRGPFLEMKVEGILKLPFRGTAGE